MEQFPNEKILKKTTDMFKEVKKAGIAAGPLGMVFEALEFLEPIMKAFQPVLDIVGALFDVLGANIIPAVIEVLQPLMDIFLGFMPLFEELGTTIGDLIASILGPLVEILGLVLEAFVPILFEILTPIIGLLGDVFDAFMPLLVSILTPIITLLKDVFDAFIPILDDVLEPLEPLLDDATAAFADLSDTIDTLTGGINVLNAYMDYCQAIWDKFAESIVEFIETIFPFIKLFESETGGVVDTIPIVGVIKDIIELQEGGIIKPPGGLFRVGEGAKPEAVMPLDLLLRHNANIEIKLEELIEYNRKLVKMTEERYFFEIMK